MKHEDLVSYYNSNKNNAVDLALNKQSEVTTNPMISNQENKDDDNDNNNKLNNFDIEAPEQNNSEVLVPKSLITEATEMIRNFKLEEYIWKSQILLIRSSKNVIKRQKLILGTNILHFFMGVMFAVIAGSVQGDVIASNSFFVFSATLLILANVQLIFYLNKSHKVSILSLISYFHNNNNKINNKNIHFFILFNRFF